MAYASKDDYVEWLRGRAETIPLAEFEFWSDQASEKIDLATFNRLRKPSFVWQSESIVLGVEMDNGNAYQKKIDEQNRSFYEISGSGNLLLNAYLAEVISTTCKVAEIIYNDESPNGRKELAGYSIGGYSESYVRGGDKTPQGRIDDAIRRGLAATGLLYRGIT